MGMNRMPARQILRRLTRREHVFPADGAVVLVLVPEALVSVKDTHGNTHATFVAMAERLHTSHAAETALRAVERLLGLTASGS